MFGALDLGFESVNVLLLSDLVLVLQCGSFSLALLLTFSFLSLEVGDCSAAPSLSCYMCVFIFNI